ncbi:hypothetical protein BDFB_014414, partial [Asbolus verrucosus]
MRDRARLEPNVLDRDCGKSSFSRTPQKEQAILGYMKDNIGRSTRGIGRTLGISKSLVHSVLRSERYHSSHYTRIQALQD